MNSYFIPFWHPALPNFQQLLQESSGVLEIDPKLSSRLPFHRFKIGYKIHENLQSILDPIKTIKKFRLQQNSENSISEDEDDSDQQEFANEPCGNSRCATCHYMVSTNTFRSKHTDQNFHIRGSVNCCTPMVVYLVECKKCSEQYVGSCFNFRSRMSGHRSDIRLGKEGCGTSQHFRLVCCDDEDPLNYFSVKIMDYLEPGSWKDKSEADIRLCSLEKEWQAKLCTIYHGMNGTSDYHNNGLHRRNFIDS